MTTLRWGIAGVGRAGRARAGAIRGDDRATLDGGWRGNPEAAQIKRFERFEDLLDAVDAVAVCAPDDAHEALVAAALDAGKHVVVEYPLAGSAPAGRALLERAAAARRVLHVEHLSPAAAWLRARCADDPPRALSVRFAGPLRAEVTGVAHGDLARLHRAWDLAGPLTVYAVTERRPGLLRARLLGRGGVVVDLDLRHDDDAARAFEMTVWTAGGATLVQTDRAVTEAGRAVILPPSPGLFATDQRTATARILDGAASYVSDARILAVLGLADALAEAPLSYDLGRAR